jgi:lipoprotein-anchoring transpeptidase ErfK/SrfK
MFRPLLLASAALIAAASSLSAGPEIRNELIISVAEQKLMLLQNGARVKTYPISTSKFGLGDGFGTYATPLGTMAIAQKIGDGAPLGAVFKRRQLTGEILKPNAPGRDPIMTRILWLRGLEPENRHAFARCIYIHGTTEEKFIGKKASYGCIRMKSKDVVEIYNQLPVGAIVQVVPGKLPRVAKAKKVYQYQAPPQPVEAGREESLAQIDASTHARGNRRTANRQQTTTRRTDG